MSDSARLTKWFERQQVTNVQAAFMLAGVTPVKNPNPRMNASTRDWHGHILEAVKAGRLAVAGPIERRIDVSSEYRDSLTIEELERFRSEWITLADPTEIQPDAGTYRFEIETRALTAWAGTQPATVTSTSNINITGFHLAALQLAWRGGAPKAAAALREDMENHGIPDTPSRNVMEAAVREAKKNTPITYPDVLFGRAPKNIKALFTYAAACQGKPLDSDEKAIPVLSKMLADSHPKLPIPNVDQWKQTAFLN